jgi:hypothetical protein
VELSLVPREGEKLLSPEEREEMKRRIRTIKPAELEVFSNTDRQQIQVFLARLIELSEHLHHDMEDEAHVMEHQEQIADLHSRRQALFAELPPKIEEFVHLIDLCAAEPWLEYEVFLHRLQGIRRKRYFDVKNKQGVGASQDNPFLMELDDLGQEKQDAMNEQTRLTDQDIEGLIFGFPLEELVSNLIDARKIITGQFWDDEYYDF